MTEATPDKPLPDRETMPYRACAGIALFNRDGLVFIGRRRDYTENDDDHFAWQMPQGGIDDNEEPIDAALRELYEETNIATVSLLTAAPGWVLYDLPDDMLGSALKGKYRGQRQKWFAALFEGDETEIDVLSPGGGKHRAEFSAWRWEKLENLPAMVVPFKRSAYEDIVAAFRDIPEKLAGLSDKSGEGH